MGDKENLDFMVSPGLMEPSTGHHLGFGGRHSQGGGRHLSDP